MRYLYLLIIIFLCSCGAGNYKHAFHKQNRKHYKTKYGSTIRKPLMACKIVAKNKRSPKFEKVKRYGNSWKENASYSMAEADNPEDYRSLKRTSKIDPKNIVKDIHEKSFEEQTLAERHQIEDEVLVKNNLPKPSSGLHKKIRDQVAHKLLDHEEGDPIPLNPLFFTFDEAEFSVVDMEPFLVAVEYALQGRMILIEGHTDARGRDDYNVQLSIKRVEKIRQLMHDMGVPDDRISVVGYGEELASATIDNEDDHQLHRRVDFTAF